MTKPEIAYAGTADEVPIKRLQEKHLKGLEDVFGPYPESAYWLTAKVNGKLVNALGFVDRPGERQIMMLWEPGRMESIAAHYLVKEALEEAKDKTVWFVSHDGIPEQTKAMYGKWGFTRRGGNGTISVYAKDK